VLARLLFVGLAACVALTSACGATPSGDEEDEEGATSADALTVPEATGPVTFRDACRAGTSITIAAVGDVLLHSPLQQQAYTSREGHASLWKNVQPLIARADLAYANLEGPCAAGVTASGTNAPDPGKVLDKTVYSSYPQFNYHPSLVPALVEAGFDVVSTSNNHAMDRRSLGVDRTIDALHAAGLPFVGTRRSDDDHPTWSAITEAKGVRVGWVGCTFSTNGIADPKNQVLSCYEDKSTVLSTIRSLAREVDAVIVTPHWGVEYEHTPEAREKALAREMLEAGALAILGNHPHVVQPMEKVTTSDGREGFVIYSMGNFVSGQPNVPRRSSLVLYLGLTKGTDGKVTINGVRHVPLWMDKWTVRPADRGGAEDGLALTTRLLGKWNRLGSDEPLVTNPDCR
jgi:hypothetical protein